jgi:hypothetical protein
MEKSLPLYTLTHPLHTLAHSPIFLFPFVYVRLLRLPLDTTLNTWYRLKLHFGAIGCKLRNAQVDKKSAMVAQLTVPLQFAQVSKGRSKR